MSERNMQKISDFLVTICFYFCVLFLFTTNSWTTGTTTTPKIEIVEPNVTELEVNAGDNFTITCKGSVPVKWNGRAFRRNKKEEAPTVTESLEYEDGIRIHISTLHIYQANIMDVGFLSCLPNDSISNSADDKIYIYVKDEKHLLMQDRSSPVQHVYEEYDQFHIPCRPTARDVEVRLTIEGRRVIPDDEVTYDRKTGYIFHSVSTNNSGPYICTASLGNYTENNKHKIIVRVNERPLYTPKPTIKVDPDQIIIGRTVNMKCLCQNVLLTNIDWIVPRHELNKGRHIHIMNLNKTEDNKFIYKTLIIKNVTKEDEGTYSCTVKNIIGTEKASHKLKVYDHLVTFINLSIHRNMSVEAWTGSNVMLTVNIDAYPLPKSVAWYGPNKKEIQDKPDSKNGMKYKITTTTKSSKLKIYTLNMSDSGTYELVVKNEGHKQSINITLFVKDIPRLTMGNNPDYYMVNKTHKIESNIIAFPEPKIECYFEDCSQNSTCKQCTKIIETSYAEVISNGVFFKSTITLPAEKTGKIICKACNTIGCSNISTPFLLTDVQNGFSASAREQAITTYNITLHCGASKYNYSSDIHWYYKQGNTMPSLISNSSDKVVTYIATSYSHNVLLNIPHVKLLHSGEYICKAKKLSSNSSEERKVPVNVKQRQPPILLESSNMNRKIEKLILQAVEWNCFVHGTPTPSIVWLKDKKHLENSSRYALFDNNQILKIQFLRVEDEGDYTCIAESIAGRIEATGSVILTDKPRKDMIVIISIFTIILGIALAFMTALYIKKLMRSRKLEQELTAAGLLHFEQGCIESLNPDIDLKDQAENLPYDKRWEFPKEKLKLGKQLGSGAFGVVVKAEAYGLIEPDVPTVIAVKMVKRNCDFTHIKALASELKIMIHLGKHLNVVNVLGACTGNLKHRELLVMVEYCHYGNLHNYLLRHRDAFINQVNSSTGKFDSTFIALSPRLKYAQLSFVNEGVQSNGSQNDETLVTSDMSTTSALPSEDEYLIFSPLRGDYKATSVRPVCTQDLLCWGFQVARGMEYLASRKVLHGDLAARNILLADENVVKISDFGFSKSMYKDSYHKKSNGPLPVKWMSIEALEDRVFSIQSDVWAFGIVLWEFFSLAQTPYPGMEADEKLFKKLVEGYRMDRPKYATNEVYEVMLECWHKTPQMRPLFIDLAEKLGSMLEDTVRTHYVDMNDPFLKSNTEFLAQQDYLSMLRSPTYSNWQSSPFDGYMMMKPSSTDAKDAMELTPMLNSEYTTGNSDTESIPNSPTNKPNTPIGNNYVNVTQVLGFSNPNYHNLDRPKTSPYINMTDSAVEN